MIECQEFLETLFAGKPEGTYILLWTLPDKKSYWCEDVTRAVTVVEELTESETKTDIYFGLGLSPKDFGSRKRCPAESVSGISCLWADIDFAESKTGEKRELDLPTNLEAVAQALSAFPKPNIIVSSGHGAHYYWLLDKPLVFDNKEKRDEGSSITKSWTNALQAEFKKKGWKIDSAHDISRVLRVPGTVNYKREKTEVVELKTLNPLPKLTLEKALEIIKNITGSDSLVVDRGVPAQSNGGDFILSPNATPPFKKFAALCEAEVKFRKSYYRKRTDMKDNSPSAYDLSLATIALQADWKEQEIVNLLIASRNHNGEDLKLRQDYFHMTLKKAKPNWTANDMKIEAGESVESKTKFLSSKFNVEIHGIVKYLADEPTYRLKTERGEIHLGTVRGLIDQINFRSSVAAATGILVPMIKSAEWQVVAQNLLDICEPVEIGEEATEVGTAEEWLSSYLRERPATEKIEDAAAHRSPFSIRGENGISQTYIFGASFRKWLRNRQGEKISSREMGRILRHYGCKPEKINFDDNGARSTLSVWRLKK